jgi:hypothetical protein
MKIFSYPKTLVVNKHEKEKVTLTLLEKTLEVSCFIFDEFDTDSLATFSRRISKKIKKLQLQMPYLYISTLNHFL